MWKPVPPQCRQRLNPGQYRHAGRNRAKLGGRDAFQSAPRPHRLQKRASETRAEGTMPDANTRSGKTPWGNTSGTPEPSPAVKADAKPRRGTIGKAVRRS